MPNNVDCLIEIQATHYPVGSLVFLDAVLNNDDIVIGDNCIEDMVKDHVAPEVKPDTFTPHPKGTHEVTEEFWVFTWSIISELEMSGVKWMIDSTGAEYVFEPYHDQLLKMFLHKQEQLKQLNQAKQHRLNQSKHDERHFHIITVWQFSYHYGSMFEDDDCDVELLGWLDTQTINYVDLNHTVVTQEATMIEKYRNALEETKGKLMQHDHEFYTKALGYNDNGEIVEPENIYDKLATEFGITRIEVKNRLFKIAYTRPPKVGPENLVDYCRRCLRKQGLKQKENPDGKQS